MPRQPPAKIVAKRLRQARLARADLTQMKVGIALGMKDKAASVRITRYESGHHAPDAQTLIDLSRILGVPPAFLLTEDDTQAAAILAFSMLPASKRKKALSDLLELIGPAKAEKVQACLVEPPPPGALTNAAKRAAKRAGKAPSVKKAPRKPK